MKKTYITWGQVNKLLDKIHEQASSEVKYVSGIPRGGLILAVLYSHRFGVQFMEYPSNHYPQLLILDECTNSLDMETEKQIIDEVNSLKGKKTIIMITHRLSTLENCDHIYKIGKEGLKLEKG